MIAKALLIVVAALIAVTHPAFVAPVFGVLEFGAAHVVVVALVLELATVAALGWLIAEAVARGRGPRRLALS